MYKLYIIAKKWYNEYMPSNRGVNNIFLGV